MGTNGRRGLSTIEMVATLVVLLIVSAIAGGTYGYMRNTAQQQHDQQQLTVLAAAQKLHYDTYGTFYTGAQAAEKEPGYTFTPADQPVTGSAISLGEETLPLGGGTVNAAVLVSGTNNQCVSVAATTIGELWTWEWVPTAAGCSVRQAIRALEAAPESRQVVRP